MPLVRDGQGVCLRLEHTMGQGSSAGEFVSLDLRVALLEDRHLSPVEGIGEGIPLKERVSPLGGNDLPGRKVPGLRTAVQIARAEKVPGPGRAPFQEASKGMMNLRDGPASSTVEEMG